MTNETVGLPLFTEPTDPPLAPYRRNSATSLAAAVAITPKVGTIARAVLAALVDGPLVIDAVAAKIGRLIGTTRPRITELKLAGLVIITERHGRSIFGKPQAVVGLTFKGREHASQNLVNPNKVAHASTVADSATDSPQLFGRNSR